MLIGCRYERKPEIISFKKPCSLCGSASSQTDASQRVDGRRTRLPGRLVFADSRRLKTRNPPWMSRLLCSSSPFDGDAPGFFLKVFSLYFYPTATFPTQLDPTMNIDRLYFITTSRSTRGTSNERRSFSFFLELLLYGSFHTFPRVQTPEYTATR